MVVLLLLLVVSCAQACEDAREWVPKCVPCIKTCHDLVVKKNTCDSTTHCEENTSGECFCPPGYARVTTGAHCIPEVWCWDPVHMLFDIDVQSDEAGDPGHYVAHHDLRKRIGQTQSQSK